MTDRKSTSDTIREKAIRGVRHAIDEMRTRLVAELRENMDALRAQKKFLTPKEAVWNQTLDTFRDALRKVPPASIQFAFEYAMPINERYEDSEFFESLVRLTDAHGKSVQPFALFDALDNMKDQKLATTARAWMTMSQIMNFYEQYEPTEALSINLMASDIKSPLFRKALEETLAQSHLCGFAPVVLEATEYIPWKKPELTFLKKMAKDFGTRIAVDDFGATDGHNDAESLADFVKYIPAGHLIVKIDGKVIENFLERGDKALVSRLEEIRNICPDAMVVGEWLSRVKTRTLLEKLEPYHLDKMLHAIQDRDLKKETASGAKKQSR